MTRKVLAVLLTWMLLFAGGCAAVPAQQQTPTTATAAAAEPAASTEASAVETESQESEAPTDPEEIPGLQLPHRFADKAEGIALLCRSAYAAVKPWTARA